MRSRVCSCWACVPSALPLCCLRGFWHMTFSGVRRLPSSTPCVAGAAFFNLVCLWRPLTEWVERAVSSWAHVLDGNVMLELLTSRRVAHGVK